MSIIRYVPAKGTAGLARSRVRGKRRSPAPPARSTPSVSFIVMVSQISRNRPGNSNPPASDCSVQHQALSRAAQASLQAAGQNRTAHHRFHNRCIWWKNSRRSFSVKSCVEEKLHVAVLTQTTAIVKALVGCLLSLRRFIRWIQELRNRLRCHPHPRLPPQCGASAGN